MNKDEEMDSAEGSTKGTAILYRRQSDQKEAGRLQKPQPSFSETANGSPASIAATVATGSTLATAELGSIDEGMSEGEGEEGETEEMMDEKLEREERAVADICKQAYSARINMLRSGGASG